MKHSKIAVLLATALLSFAVLGCKTSTNDDDGNSMTNMDAPNNLVINSITRYDATYSGSVNFSFNYNGAFDGVTEAILGYSTTNDSSTAIYDSYTSRATVESGANTRTVTFENWLPTDGKKYYFWLKITSSSNNRRDSDWSNVAEFTYTATE
jgi:hypothetical protein